MNLRNLQLTAWTITMNIGRFVVPTYVKTTSTERVVDYDYKQIIYTRIVI